MELTVEVAPGIAPGSDGFCGPTPAPVRCATNAFRMPVVPARHHLGDGVGLAGQVGEPLDPLDEDVAAGR